MKKQYSLTWIAITMVSLFYTSYSNGQKIKGDGDIQRQTRPITPFNQIKIGGVFNTYLSQGEKESVIVEADSNLFPIIQTEVKNKKLIVRLKSRNIKNSTKISLYITLKNLNELYFDGVGNVSCKTNLNLTNLKIINSGVGNITLKGMASLVTILNSGVGNIKAFDFVVKQLNIKNKGVGNIEVNSTETLSISNSGMGTITYKGDATIKTLNSSGMGKIIKK